MLARIMEEEDGAREVPKGEMGVREPVPGCAVLALGLLFLGSLTAWRVVLVLWFQH